MPFSKDLYDEHIPELSSYREEDSLTSKPFGGLGKSVASRVYDDSELHSSKKNFETMMGRGTLKQTKDFNELKKSYETPLLNSKNDRITITSKPTQNKLLHLESGLSQD